jgi:hypothetical protein
MVKLHKKGKKKRNNKVIIIVVIIIFIFILLIGTGVGLYFYFNNKVGSNKSNIISEENNKIIDIKLLPSVFYINTIPLCDIKSCLQLGQKILLNQLMTSTSNINNIIIKNTLNQEEMNKKLNIYAEETIITTEETSSYYLLFYNTYANIYRYINLNGSTCKLVANGFQCNNKIIQFTGYKCIINNKIYYCDLTYYNSKNFVLLCDETSYPKGIISKNDFDSLYKNNNVIIYLLNNIQTILVTNYSILVLDKNASLIGLLTIM